ncbi:MAG: hypothetical protein HGB00_08335 [Chlorobiaceae bacterium]|nr:hypothetical protein [Chlorobiaceae bacterium]
MTIFDYIIRAYVRAILPKAPSVYRPLVDRLRSEGEITDPSPADGELLKNLVDAGIISRVTDPIVSNGEEPVKSTYFIPGTITLTMPYEQPHCPACDDAKALRAQVQYLQQRISDLEEAAYEKYCMSLTG